MEKKWENIEKLRVGEGLWRDKRGEMEKIKNFRLK